MTLFELELAPVEQIHPWGEPGNLSLSWFALTDGRFRTSSLSRAWSTSCSSVAVASPGPTHASRRYPPRPGASSTTGAGSGPGAGPVC